MSLSCHIRILEWIFTLIYLNVKELLAQNKRDILNLSNCNENWFRKHLVHKRTFNHLPPLETHEIHLLSSCKRWTSTKIGRLELLEKLWLKHKYITLSSMTQTTEKWVFLVLSRVDFWMVWRCHGIPCFCFYFV